MKAELVQIGNRYAVRRGNWFTGYRYMSHNLYDEWDTDRICVFYTPEEAESLYREKYGKEDIKIKVIKEL